MTAFESLKQQLQVQLKTWLITGVLGFISSKLLETLLKLNQSVVGLDNFSTGHQRNLDEVQTLVTSEQWAKFQFINGDIRKREECRPVMNWATPSSAPRYQSCAIDCVLHQAAVGSVPPQYQRPHHH